MLIVSPSLSVSDNAPVPQPGCGRFTLAPGLLQCPRHPGLCPPTKSIHLPFHVSPHTYQPVDLPTLPCILDLHATSCGVVLPSRHPGVVKPLLPLPSAHTLPSLLPDPPADHGRGGHGAPDRAVFKPGYGPAGPAGLQRLRTDRSPARADHGHPASHPPGRRPPPRLPRPPLARCFQTRHHSHPHTRISETSYRKRE